MVTALPRLHQTSASAPGRRLEQSYEVNATGSNYSTQYILLMDENSGSKRLELSVDANAVAKISANQSASVLSFETTNFERLRIDSSGNGRYCDIQPNA